MFSRAAKLFTLTALAAVASAEFSILSPGGDDLWWVAKSTNTLVWSCNDSPPAQQYTVFITNPDKTILPDRMAIIAQQNNFDCSKLISQDQANQPAATGYTIQLVDTLNSSHIYAESQPFEIKALGSAYPATTVSADPSQTVGITGSGSSASNTAAASNDNNSAASKLGGFAGYGAAAVGALIGLVL
ncbi:hypothetical protein VKT23_019352 [Stygiomarasmius scandens]|uniref:Ser-Thr-rich glycosyl-phosphatidyl-inositol-anchored membrane family-domain-containing protein n=1 Tax=Marasmiellus scandens TaxID=2682957 RepID=A0ABR1IPX8_9AGAR